MFTKHILPCSFVTVDGTEILRTPKRRSSIARHSIPSTFFCGSAVCLLISQNINKKNNATFKMGIFGSETTKNQLLSIKLLPKIIFRKFFTHICSYLFTFSITQNCKQTAVSLEVRMVDKFCLHIFSSHEVPQLWGEFEFLRCRDCPTYSCISS